MYWKLLFNLLLALGLFTLQASFLNVLPIVSYLNLVLVVLIFVLVLRELDWAIAWWLFLAFCFDVFAFQSFGIHLLAYGVVLILTYILLINFVTNRSLYSLLLLVGIATVIYNLAIIFASYLVGFVSKLDFSVNFWTAVGWQLVANLLMTAIIFYTLSLFSKRFKPVFLAKQVYK